MEINLSDFYVRLIVIVIIILLGLLLARMKLISAKTNGDLVSLLLTVFMPAALFSAFPAEFSASTANLFTSGLIAGLIVMLTVIVVSRLVFNKVFFKGDSRFESQFAFIFNNATFLGYPIVLTAFGATGLVPYCGFIIAFNLALFSYGVFLFKRKLSWQLVGETLINPNIIAVLLGMAVFLLRIPLPEPITQSVSIVAGATTPLSLICIGYMLSRTKIKAALKKWRLTLTAFLQLTLAPIITFAVLRLLNFPTEVVTVCTLIQALPTATSLALFSKKYGGDEVQASELVSISTVLSCITLPFIIWLLLS